MPATTERQRRFMMAELSRRRKGQKTQTGMTESQLGHFKRLQRGRKKKKNNPLPCPGSKIRSGGRGRGLGIGGGAGPIGRMR